MPADLSPLIAATAQWLTRAYPSDGGAMDSALCEAQARQAVTVAAWLRYPSPMDAALVSVAGPGGSARLDWVSGADGTAAGDDPDTYAWRTWVDEVVASWAACLLSAPALAAAAVAALAGSPEADAPAVEFRRLVTPDARDRRAAALLRHPDLLAPVAELHHERLLDRLKPGPALTA
ncbi:hypothetical protein AS594_30900 [Streptomyces agglomeratus]|uniref:Uncharacterized protein n=1 Tax=Streptomyces agglomeratus TaxID=285458 RepID=A0A1E5PJU0_9ACTN|nr:hypothetical protein [Streptomyces agglomeratus]OEJ29821.1 hypothetical protein AS594_30900 [Streptomyces agglomeratus]OEJ55472.1 hypothetical protein BGK72_05155 [Streptomyces agglomeratus]